METSAASATPLALDLSILHALIGPDPDVVAEIVATYLGSIGPVTMELRQAVEAHDAPRVRAAAHFIKSPSLSVGALPLGRLCGILEQAAAKDDWQALAQSFGTFDLVVAQTERAARTCIEANGAPP